METMTVVCIVRLYIILYQKAFDLPKVKVSPKLLSEDDQVSQKAASSISRLA